MTGKRNWAFFTGDELYISPSYAVRQNLCCNKPKRHIVLDATNRGQTGNLPTPSSCWSSPTIANGNLYVGCNDWNLYCFSNGTSYAASIPSQNSTSISILAVVIACSYDRDHRGYRRWLLNLETSYKVEKILEIFKN